MTEQQWKTLVSMVKGETRSALPTAFIIDSPWLPNWAGVSILDYYADEGVFFEANLQGDRTFPDTIMLPGFWSEYGMCTEPSAFGVSARCGAKTSSPSRRRSSEASPTSTTSNGPTRGPTASCPS